MTVAILLRRLQGRPSTPSEDEALGRTHRTAGSSILNSPIAPSAWRSAVSVPLPRPGLSAVTAMTPVRWAASSSSATAGPIAPVPSSSARSPQTTQVASTLRIAAASTVASPR